MAPAQSLTSGRILTTIRNSSDTEVKTLLPEGWLPALRRAMGMASIHFIASALREEILLRSNSFGGSFEPQREAGEWGDTARVVPATEGL